MKRAITLTTFPSLILLLAATALAAPGGDQLPSESMQATIYLPAIFGVLTPQFDMVPLLAGDGRLYEVQHSSGSQARHQSQIENTTFFHTKGNEVSAEWEELWYDHAYIYRGTDTSPGNGMFYSLRDPGMYGSAWAPRYWTVGQLFERNPHVTFYNKNDCSQVTAGYQRSWLKFEAFHSTYSFDSGLTADHVAQLVWLLEPNGQPVERYYYAEGFGLVGWWSNDHGMSYLSEIHEPGTRPDNTREVIPCLNTSPLTSPPPLTFTLPFWPGEHRR